MVGMDRGAVVRSHTSYIWIARNVGLHATASSVTGAHELQQISLSPGSRSPKPSPLLPSPALSPHMTRAQRLRPSDPPITSARLKTTGAIQYT